MDRFYAFIKSHDDKAGTSWGSYPYWTPSERGYVVEENWIEIRTKNPKIYDRNRWFCGLFSWGLRLQVSCQACNYQQNLIIGYCFQSKNQPVITYGFTPWRKSNVLKENGHIPHVVYAYLNLSRGKNLAVRYLFHTCRSFRLVVWSRAHSRSSP